MVSTVVGLDSDMFYEENMKICELGMLEIDTRMF